MSKPTVNEFRNSSILKATNQKFSHVDLWRDWTNVLSSDQLLSVVEALKISLENQEENNKVFNLYSDININPYMETLLRNFFFSYKNGDINIALANRIKFGEIYELKEKKKVRK